MDDQKSVFLTNRSPKNFFFLTNGSPKNFFFDQRITKNAFFWPTDHEKFFFLTNGSLKKRFFDQRMIEKVFFWTPDHWKSVFLDPGSLKKCFFGPRIIEKSFFWTPDPWSMVHGPFWLSFFRKNRPEYCFFTVIGARGEFWSGSSGSTTFQRIHRKRNHPVQNRPWVPRAGGQDYGSLHTNSFKLRIMGGG